MAAESKAQRREAAREAARLARAKQERRTKLMRWLVPTIVSVAIVAIVAVVIVVAVRAQPAPQAAAGPRNMISDGILFTGQNGEMTATHTAAIPASGQPTANPVADPSIPNIVTYVDLTCPVCQGFEQTYGQSLEQLVAQGKATLEVHPVAILDSRYTTDYSTRANNAVACVADSDPDQFYPMMLALYAGQAAEGSAGLSDTQLKGLLHAAGLNGPAVDSCIDAGTFEPWLKSATQRATSNPDLRSSAGFATPTVLVNGARWDNTSDFLQFVQQHS